MKRVWALACRLMLIVAVLIAAAASAVIAFRFTFVAVLFGVYCWYRRMGRWRGTSHGTAEFASLATLEAAGLLDDTRGYSLPVGRVGDFAGSVTKGQAIRALFSWQTPSHLACAMVAASLGWSRWLRNRLIYVHDFVHAAAVAKTGGGKSTGFLLPILHSYRGSVCVLDPKGELYAAVAEARRRMGHKVMIVDPMRLARAGTQSINAMAFINPGALDFADQCRDLGNALVVRQPDEKEPHFNDSAELLITAIISFIIVCSKTPGFKHLGTVLDVLSSYESVDEALEVMRDCGHPVVENFAGQCSFFQGDERASVFTTTMRHLSWLNSEATVSCIRSNDIDPLELKSQLVSLFIIMPPIRAATWSGLVRVLTACLLSRLCDDATYQHGKQKVLLLLDEIGQFRKFQALENAPAVVRGYGISILFALQSLEQLKTCFADKADEIQDNIGTTIYFNISSLKTANEMAERAGDFTLRVTTPSSNSGTSSGTSAGGQQSTSTSRSSGYSTNVNQQGRKLIMKDEVLRLQDVALIFHNQLPVIAARTLKHFADPEFQKDRMGRRRRTGLSSGIMAAAALAMSVFIMGVAIIMPVQRFQVPYGQGQRYLHPWQRPSAWSSGPVRRQAFDGRPLPSGVPHYRIPSGSTRRPDGRTVSKNRRAAQQARNEAFHGR